MYSGSDSTESQNYTQWALNPSTYQNVSSEHVDWAALAQQWIIMKEAGPPPVQQITVTPQQRSSSAKKDVQNEGGEAPMDVENDKEDDDVAPPWTNVNVPPPGDSWTWNAQQQQWGWNNAWTAPPGVAPAKPPLLPTPAGYNQFSSAGGAEVGSESSNYGSYNSTTSNDYNSAYWNSGSNSKTKPHNKRFSKVNIPRQPIVPEPVTLDAAKRKQLPAWIREGLEKMERDKQKQIEREREKQESQIESDKIKLSEKDAMEIIKSTVKENTTKYESDKDTESEDGDTADSKFRAATPEPVPLTQEELMLKVRRTMTEILLSVTTREIQQICKEELQRYISKTKASDDRVSAASGTNFTAKLGLGMYGGDSGSSSEDSEDETKQDTRDSDSELRETIKRRKMEFSKIEREIEEKLAEADKTGDQSRGATPETNDNDSQVDAKMQGGNRSRNSSSERTPPLKPTSHELKRHRSRKSSSYSDESSSDRDRKKSKRKKHQQQRKSSSSDSSSSNNRHHRSSRDRRSRRSSESKETSRRYSRSSSRRRSRSISRRDSYQYSSRRSRTRSPSRSRHKSSRNKRTRSRSRSRHRRSRSRDSYRRRSRSRRRSSSSSRKSYHRRRSRSSSSGRGKRSHRH